jgi:hypothetical protein
MRLLILLVCVPLFAADDAMIAPGVGVGPITALTTRADLGRLFPADAIEDDQIELDEGMLQPATMIYKKDPARTLAISWKDEHPKEIFICFGRRRGPCRWESQGGVKTGIRLNELERMNGKPFTISGFGWNYGGNVQSWDGGKLAKLDCNGRLVLTLDGDRSRGGDYTIELTSEERHSVSGDRPISSSVPAMRKLNPAVVGMLYQFPSAGGAKCE